MSGWIQATSGGSRRYDSDEDLTFLFRCVGCSQGWFDLGGPAWRALTGGAPPGKIHGVKSSWVTCPGELASGNIQVYVKPGSDPWDARFQVSTLHCNFCT